MESLESIRLKKLLSGVFRHSRTEELFRLADGRSKSFIDLSRIIYSPEVNYLLGKVFWDKMHEMSKLPSFNNKMKTVRAVGGLTMVADAIACSVAHYSFSKDWQLGAFTFLKWMNPLDGTSKILGSVKVGDKVVIVEGIARKSSSPTYHSAIHRAIASALEFGLDVVSVVALIDMSEKETCGEIYGFRVNSIFTLLDLLEASHS